MKNYHNRLKEAIKKSGTNQKELSFLFGWAESTLSEIVQGKSDPGVSRIIQLVQYLNININWLFTGRGPIFNHSYSNTGKPAVVQDSSEPFNHYSDEFTELAFKTIQEERITQDELVAAVREVRRRRTSVSNDDKQPNTAHIEELK